MPWWHRPELQCRCLIFYFLCIFYLFYFISFFFFLAQNCSGLRTCFQCLEHPECGWCGDPSSTGKGLCMEGSYRGPMKRPAKQGQPVQGHLLPQDMSLELGSCPREKGFEWAFIQCPGKRVTSCLSYWNYRSSIPSVLSRGDGIAEWISYGLQLKKMLLSAIPVTAPMQPIPPMDWRLVCHLMCSFRSSLCWSHIV